MFILPGVIAIIVISGIYVGIVWFAPSKDIEWEDSSQICISKKLMKSWEIERYCIEK